MTLFGNGVFADVNNELKMKSDWVRVDLKSNAGSLLEERTHRHTQGRRLWENRGRDLRCSCKLRMAWRHQKLGRGKDRFFPGTFKRSRALLTA